MLLITVDLDGVFVYKMPREWDGMPHMGVPATERNKTLLNFINGA